MFNMDAPSSLPQYPINDNCENRPSNQMLTDEREENTVIRICSKKPCKNQSIKEFREDPIEDDNDGLGNKSDTGYISFTDRKCTDLKVNNSSFLTNTKTERRFPQSINIPEMSWKCFWKVREFPAYSKRPTIMIKNQSSQPLQLCTVEKTGQLNPLLHSCPCDVATLPNSDGMQSFFFIVQNEETREFQAALIGNYSQAKLIHVNGPNYVILKGSDWSFDHKCDIQWPVQSPTSGKLVSLIIKNKRKENSFSVNRVNERGRETMFIEKVKKKSKWLGQVVSGSVLVFRIYKNGRFLDNVFYYAVSIPLNTIEFTIKFDY